MEAGDFDGDGRTELAVIDSSATWEEERLPVIQTFERYADGFLGPQPAPITQQDAQGGDEPKLSDDFGLRPPATSTVTATPTWPSGAGARLLGM